MKNFLFILTLLFGMLLFVPEDVQDNDTMLDLQAQKEAVMMEKGTADTFNIRLLKIEERATQYFRLKEINLLRKVSEVVTTHQTINFSTLLCRMGYHVYALRKIII